MNTGIPETLVFTRMPYTRADLLQAIRLVTNDKYVSDSVKLNVSLETMLLFARMVMWARNHSPYEPSCRVIREAIIDLEFFDRFNFHGESG
jgi:hypothetical protein